MLKWISELTGSIDDRRHALGTERGLAEFKQMLPMSQPSAATRDVCDALEETHAAGLTPAAFQRALCELDQHVQPALDVLRHMLFRDSRGEKVSDVSQRSLVDYASRVAPLYAVALTTLKPGAASEETGAAGVLALRAMRQLMELKKFARAGYQAPPQALWSDIHRIHATATRLGVLRAQVNAYPGDGDKLSAHQEYLCGLLLETAPLGSLLPTQIECLDLLLHTNAGALAFGDAAAAEMPFYFDLERPGPPQRWLPGLAKRPGTRFIGPGAIGGQLETMANAARKAAEVPDWAVPSECDLEGFVALLRILRAHWSQTPPQRRDRRTASSGSEVLIVHGLVQARRMVSTSELAKSDDALTEYKPDAKARSEKREFDKVRFGSLNPDKTTTGKLLRKSFVPPKQLLEKLETAGDRQLIQRSSVADTSDSGMGVSIPAPASWARLGVLLGYRFPDSIDWELAIIRRISRGTGQISLGLERLAGRLRTAHFLPEQDMAAAQARFGSQLALEALLLETNVLVLIAPAAQYRAGQAIILGLGFNARPMRIASVLGSGRDYCMVALEPG